MVRTLKFLSYQILSLVFLSNILLTSSHLDLCQVDSDLKSESEHQNNNNLNGSLITNITKDVITTLSCDHHDSQTEDGNHKDHIICMNIRINI